MKYQLILVHQLAVPRYDNDPFVTLPKDHITNKMF